MRVDKKIKRELRKIGSAVKKSKVQMKNDGKNIAEISAMVTVILVVTLCYGNQVDPGKENESVNPLVGDPGFKESVRCTSDSDKILEEIAQMQAEEEGLVVKDDAQSTEAPESKKLDNEVELLLGDDPGAKK
ncbi:hypothetical protein Zmor_018575 [Zophobas morio]|uniref:Uncharacterized protein n=1 Tax=Zophobas morio TaxID=2755281 RepID=A0AA38MDZ0_9CUCU|nr:hypothetical protein Zmor_018575 [Zophobas morio]